MNNMQSTSYLTCKLEQFCTLDPAFMNDEIEQVFTELRKRLFRKRFFLTFFRIFSSYDNDNFTIYIGTIDLLDNRISALCGVSNEKLQEIKNKKRVHVSIDGNINSVYVPIKDFPSQLYYKHE